MNANSPGDSVHPETREEWRNWLSERHDQISGIWLIYWKKGSGKSRLTYEESVEEALCFGWIDSKPRSLDNEKSMVWFAPRKAGSGWSRLNKVRVEAAILEGRMTDAGLAKIAAAKYDGSWQKLDEVENLVSPPDLVSALTNHPLALDNYELFPRSVKRNILEWIMNAKTAETRAKRIEETASRASVNERANQWRRKEE